MGRNFIVGAADFSRNAITELNDITQLVDASGRFFPRKAVNSFVSTVSTENAKRCAIIRLCIHDLVQNLDAYSKIRINIKGGFDFALGMCRSSEDVDNYLKWLQLDGERESGGAFAWVTDKQYAEVAVSSEMYITGNIRYDDNTTEFSSTAKFSDFAEIILIP